MIGHLLNTTLTVYRATFVADGRGGRTETRAAVGSIRAMIEQPSEAERAIAAQIGSTLSHIVHTTHDSDVQRGDELDAGGPRRLRVIATVANSRSTYLRLHCELLQGG